MPVPSSLLSVQRSRLWTVSSHELVRRTTSALAKARSWSRCRKQQQLSTTPRARASFCSTKSGAVLQHAKELPSPGQSSEYFHHQIGAKTLFATHYRELTELAERYPGIVCYQAEVMEVGSTLLFPHRIVRGTSDHSFGIHVAQMAGMPDAIVERARTILSQLERTSPSAPEPLRIAAEQTVQLSIFEAAPDPIREQLRMLDMERMTPLKAFRVLAELAERARQ